jgi:hypothetical protein
VVRLAAVLPVGPRCDPEFVADTIESIEYYCVSDHLVVLVDDSQRGTARLAAQGHERVTVIETPQSRGNRGGLYLSLSEGFAAALREPTDVVLRLDSDALVAGSGWEARALELFDQHRRLGSLGHHRVTPMGEPRDYSYAAGRIARAISLRGLVDRRDPKAWWRARSLVREATQRGYEPGEAIMGGIAVYRPAALLDLQGRGMLGDPALSGMGIEEDQIFALALRASGWHLGEFGSDHDDLPMYARHAGLAAHPDEILAKHKALVHSTKRWDDLDEPAIRERFRAARVAGRPNA